MTLPSGKVAGKITLAGVRKAATNAEAAAIPR